MLKRKHYRIAGKFSEEFNLANWLGIEIVAELKNRQILMVTHKNARALRKIYASR